MQIPLSGHRLVQHRQKKPRSLNEFYFTFCDSRKFHNPQDYFTLRQQYFIKTNITRQVIKEKMKIKTRNRCYTYFRIVGDFCPDNISDILGLLPETVSKKGDACRNGAVCNFSEWTFGRCDDYDVEVDNQMRKTIAPLLDKIPLLNKIRAENDVSFYLEVVPTIYCGELTPCLAPSLDVIDFCHATRTEIDIDLYVLDPSDDE